MAKTKYIVKSEIGTTAEVVQATIVRVFDGQELPFIPAPLKIYDISVIGNPASDGHLRIKRDGQVVYATAPYSLLKTDLANKRIERVFVSGTANNLITFDVLVVKPLSTGTEIVQFAIEVEE
jgi:hypothetical protein